MSRRIYMEKVKRRVAFLLALVMAAGLIPDTAAAAGAIETDESAPSYTIVEGIQLDHADGSTEVGYDDAVERDTAACWVPTAGEGQQTVRKGEITVIEIPAGDELPEEFTEKANQRADFTAASADPKSEAWQLFGDQVQVSFDPNGGTWSGSTEAATYQIAAGTIAVYPDRPARSGHLFAGWALAADAATPVYLPDDKIPFVDGEVYYAVWEELYGYSFLTANQKKAYEALEIGVRTYQTSVGVDPALAMTKDDITLIRDMLESDYPEYFWFSGGMSLVLQSGAVKGVKPKYEIDGLAADAATIQQADTVFSQRVNQVLAEMNSAAGNSDYDRALWLHDKVASLVTYTFTVNDQTAYGALVDGAAVCAGYAALYQLLLQRAGIKAWTVIGTSKNPVSGAAVAHAWTLMWLDGKCLYTDVTWDDQASSVFHAYFARSLSVMGADHTPDTDYATKLPSCTTECGSCGYFDQVAPECKVSGSYSETVVGEHLEGDSKGSVWTAVLYHPEGADFKTWLSSASLSKMITAGGLPSGTYSFSAKIFGGTGPGREVHITIMAVVNVSGTVTGATSGVTTVQLRSLDGKDTVYSTVVNSGTFVFSKVGAATGYELTIEEPGCCPLWYSFTTERKALRLSRLSLNPLLELNVSGSAATPTVNVSGLPSGVTGAVMVAQYNSDGRMKAIRMISGLQPKQTAYVLNNFTHAAGDTYWAGLLNQSGYSLIYSERIGN